MKPISKKPFWLKRYRKIKQIIHDNEQETGVEKMKPFWLKRFRKINEIDRKNKEESYVAKICTINELPDEILMEIFEFLSPKQRISCERVNKRWEKLLKSTWTKFSVINETNHFDNVHILKSVLSRCGEYLKHLFVGQFEKNGEESTDAYLLLNIAEYCPNLEFVEIHCDQCRLTNNLFKNFVSRCSRLKSVTFGGKFVKKIRDIHLKILFSHCRRLISLTLSDNRKITAKAFCKLPRRLKRLKCCLPVRQGLQVVADRCRDLEVLDLESTFHITKNGFDYTFRKLDKLQILRMSSYRSTLDLNPFRLRQLRELYLRDNFMIGERFFDGVSRNCVNIERLDISDCGQLVSDEILFYLCRLKRLTKLNLGFSRGFTDVGLSCLAKEGRLKMLNLRWCHQLTDESILNVIKFCTNLIHLDISCCEKITDRSISALTSERNVERVSLCLHAFGLNISSVCSPKLILKFTESSDELFFDIDKVVQCD